MAGQGSAKAVVTGRLAARLEGPRMEELCVLLMGSPGWDMLRRGRGRRLTQISEGEGGSG